MITKFSSQVSILHSPKISVGGQWGSRPLTKNGMTLSPIEPPLVMRLGYEVPSPVWWCGALPPKFL